MSHKTMIDGVAYEISGGKTLIGGTAYSIKYGKTLVDDTAYEVELRKFVMVCDYGTFTTNDQTNGIPCYTKKHSVPTGFEKCSIIKYDGTDYKVAYRFQDLWISTYHFLESANGDFEVPKIQYTVGAGSVTIRCTTEGTHTVQIGYYE